jgi:hypothetical protein
MWLIQRSAAEPIEYSVSFLQLKKRSRFSYHHHGVVVVVIDMLMSFQEHYRLRLLLVLQSSAPFGWHDFAASIIIVSSSSMDR